MNIEMSKNKTVEENGDAKDKEEKENKRVNGREKMITERKGKKAKKKKKLSSYM